MDCRVLKGRGMVRLSVLMLTSIIMLQACSKAVEEAVNEATSTIPPVGNQETPPERTQFFIHGTAAKGVDVITHLESDWNKPCAIDLDASSTSERDLLCTIEVKELDVYHQGLKFNYNAPKSNKCVYMATKPYFFYQYEPVDGPTQVNKEIAADGTISLVGTSNVTLIGGDPVCNFNYGAFTPGAPNCCLGSASLKVTDKTKTPEEITNSRIDWGGRPGNCIAGAALQFSTDVVTGMPLTEIERLGGLYAETEFNKTMELSSPISSGFRSNLYIANYFTGATPVGFDTPARCTACSAAIYTPQRYYTWTCYDEAKEAYARIRVQVREWNVATEFAKKETGNWNLNRTNSEGSPWNESYNDFADWADFGTSTYIENGL